MFRLGQVIGPLQLLQNHQSRLDPTDPHNDFAEFVRERKKGFVAHVFRGNAMLVAKQGRSHAMGGVREDIVRHGFTLHSLEDLTAAVFLISKEVPPRRLLPTKLLGRFWGS